MRSLTGFNSGSLDGSFAPGQPISASKLNLLAGSADKSRPMFSNDIQFMSTGGGVAYGVPNQVYYAPTLNPLDPVLDGDKVTVVPGTVNRYIPKIGSTYIDASPPPKLTVTNNGYILVKVTYEANKFFPRTAEIVFEAVASPPADTNTESYYPLAKVNKTMVDAVVTYSLQYFENGNLAVNRLKAGNNVATWWWTRV